MDFKADQIFYSVLCVFSYIAAGQEQRKATQQKNAGGTQKHHHHHHHHHQQQQPAQKQQSVQPTNEKPTQPIPSQIKPQTVIINQTVQPQKPAVTIATVQPQTVPIQMIPSSTKS